MGQGEELCLASGKGRLELPGQRDVQIAMREPRLNISGHVN